MIKNPVSDADGEIPTLGSTDNAGNEVYWKLCEPRFRHYPWDGMGFFGLHR